LDPLPLECLFASTNRLFDGEGREIHGSMANEAPGAKFFF
jgi:hypothetical protein